MILDNSLYGNFYGNPFVIGTTNRNEYYPVYAVSDELINQVYHYNGERLSEPIVDDILLYKKPINNAKRKYGGLNKYAELFACLAQSANPDVFEFTINEESHYLNCSKGYMSDIDDNILLILCSNSPELFNHRGELNTKNLRLYVSNRLVNNEVYKNIFKKIDSEYIHFCYENDIDVIFTTSEKIQKQVFDNDFKVEFENLTELHEHLNSGIGNNLFFDGSVYYPEPVEEDLPF